MQILKKIMTEEYIYQSEEEREAHRNEMMTDGWNASEQIKKDIDNSIHCPDYRFYGLYTKNYK